MNIKNLGEKISSLIIVFLLLAASAMQNGKILGTKTDDFFSSKNKKEAKAPTKKQLLQAGYNTVKLEKIQNGIWKIKDVNDNLKGNVITSIVFSKKIFGYAGRIPLLIFTNSEQKITHVSVLKNHETPSFMRRVKAKGIVSQWIGKNINEISKFKPDAVSGATMTSVAINKSIQKSVAILSSNKSNYTDFKLDWDLKTWLAILVIISGVFISIFKAKNKSLRIIQLILNTLILGFWCGKFLSFEIFLGWTTNGMNILTNFTLFLMLVFAIILPIFTKKKSFYCTWLCPFGSAQELAGKITKKKVRIPNNILKYLKYSQKIITLALFFCLWIGIASDIVNYEPFSAFIFQHASWAVLVIALLSIVTSVFINRPWCRFVCPTGQILNWTNKLK